MCLFLRRTNEDRYCFLVYDLGGPKEENPVSGRRGIEDKDKQWTLKRDSRKTLPGGADQQFKKKGDRLDSKSPSRSEKPRNNRWRNQSEIGKEL